MTAYDPTIWVNNQAPPLSAANLNKLTDELKAQASDLYISHTLGTAATWTDGAAPALTEAATFNEMERVCKAVADATGFSYTPTAWENGWIPGRNATRFNHLEIQAAANRGAIDAQPETATWYGVPFKGDSLWNTTLNGQSVSFRFRAEQSSQAEQLIWYNENNDPGGYWAGDGGDVLVQLRTDDGTFNHYPAATVLGSYLISSPLSTSQFPLNSFSPAASLTAGTLYHIVFSNPSASPSSNYTSVNAMWGAHTSPALPTIPDTDLAVLLGNAAGSGGWSVRQDFCPIYNLYYSNGIVQGMGYMECWVGTPAIQPIGGSAGTNRVRQTMTPSGVKVVTGGGIRVRRITGSSPLVVSLRNSAGGLVESVSIDSSSISTSYGYVPFSFSTQHTLTAGSLYWLEFSATAGTTYQVTAIRQGSGYGLSSQTYFVDGVAQYWSGSNWATWIDSWGGTANGAEADLQFYLEVT